MKLENWAEGQEAEGRRGRGAEGQRGRGAEGKDLLQLLLGNRAQPLVEKYAPLLPPVLYFP